MQQLFYFEKILFQQLGVCRPGLERMNVEHVTVNIVIPQSAALNLLENPARP